MKPPSLSALRRILETPLWFALLTSFSACGDDSDVASDDVVPVGGHCEQTIHASEPGVSPDETNLQVRSTQCEGAVCLAHGFQGRPGCPFGKLADEPPDADCDAAYEVAVPPQLVARPPEEAMYCTCRCAGPPGSDYCTCPAGMSCSEMVPFNEGTPDDGLAGSYCTKLPADFDTDDIPDATCDRELMNCPDR